MNSPLAIIAGILSRVRQRAIADGLRLSENEAYTRSSLINPVLCTLGWDTDNPNEIDFNRSFLNSTVDYALINYQEKAKVFVKVKALGEKVDDNKFMASLVPYAMASGLEGIFLTNGLIWDHFYDFQPGKAAMNHTLDLSKDNLVECAEYFVTQLDKAKYWPVNYDEIMIEENQKPGQVLILKKQAPTTYETNNEFVELEKLQTNLTGMTPPKKLRLPDGSIIQIKKWRNVLSECCLFVMRNYPDLPVPLPDLAGKTVNLIGLERTMPGVTYLELMYNNKTVFVYLNYDTNHTVANARHLIGFLPEKKFKFSPAVSF